MSRINYSLKGLTLMFYEKRNLLFHNYNRARDYFISCPNQLIDLEQYCAELVNNIIMENYDEIEANYNESSYLNAFWAKYPPDDRGRQPVGDQIPWIEVGEHSIGHKLSRIIGTLYRVSEIGLPGIWNAPNKNMENSTMVAKGKRTTHLFYPAISPIYPLTNGDVAPTIHLYFF